MESKRRDQTERQLRPQDLYGPVGKQKLKSESQKTLSSADVSFSILLQHHQPSHLPDQSSAQFQVTSTDSFVLWLCKRYFGQQVLETHNQYQSEFSVHQLMTTNPITMSPYFAGYPFQGNFNKNNKNDDWKMISCPRQALKSAGISCIWYLLLAQQRPLIIACSFNAINPSDDSCRSWVGGIQLGRLLDAALSPWSLAPFDVCR